MPSGLLPQPTLANIFPFIASELMALPSTVAEKSTMEPSPAWSCANRRLLRNSIGSIGGSISKVFPASHNGTWTSAKTVVRRMLVSTIYKYSSWDLTNALNNNNPKISKNMLL